MSKEPQQERIAIYEVHFEYKDGKRAQHNLPESMLSRFFETLNKKNIFWYEESTELLQNGFWTNLDDIRCIHIKGIKGVPHASKIEKHETKVEISKVESLPMS